MAPTRTTTLDRAALLPPPPAVRFEHALKDRAVEEPVNLHLHRRVAFAVVGPLVPVRAVTPNHLTALGVTVGLASGAAAWFAERGLGEAGWALSAALLLGAIVLDCADGMLARLRGGGTRFGMLLDGVADHVVGGAVFTGVAASSVPAVGGAWAWALASVALGSTVAHCALYDRAKAAFLGEVDGMPRARFGDRGGAFERVFGAAHLALYGFVGRVLGDRGATLEPDALRRARLAPAMARMRWLGLGAHLTVLLVAAFAGAADARAPFWIAVTLIAGVGNAAALWAVLAWRRTAQGRGAR